jgi:stage IV sporulation protein FA
MIKLNVFSKKQREEEPELTSWRGQHPSAYESYPDMTRSSIFSGGKEEWDPPVAAPVFSSRPEAGRAAARTYEDFLRARSLSRPYEGGGGLGWSRLYGERPEEQQGLSMHRVMQIVGSVALVGLLYTSFQSDQPFAQRVEAYVKQAMTQDADMGAVATWWQKFVSEKAVPASAGMGSNNAAKEFVLPVQGKVKVPFDGQEQQGVTIAAALGAEVKAANAGVVERVEKSGQEDYTVTLNHGSQGKTIYRHLVTVNVAVNDWVDANHLLGTLSRKDNADLFFAYQKDGLFHNPADILPLAGSR